MKMCIYVVQGDIIKLVVDVIVNVVNLLLMGGGGVDGVIYCVVGLVLLDVCLKVRQQQGDCFMGYVVIMFVGDFFVKVVVYIVGLVWCGGE